MNVCQFELGSGKSTCAIIQSILKRSPLICSGIEEKKELVKNGKLICNKLFPGDKITMPDPITFKEFDSGNFNSTYNYIFYSIEDYFKYKNINILSMFIEEQNKNN